VRLASRIAVLISIVAWSVLAGFYIGIRFSISEMKQPVTAVLTTTYPATPCSYGDFYLTNRGEAYSCQASTEGGWWEHTDTKK